MSYSIEPLSEGTVLQQVDHILDRIVGIMRHRLAPDIRVIAYLSYILLKARSADLFKDDVPEDLQDAVETMNHMSFMTKASEDEPTDNLVNSIVSLKLDDDFYLELFHTLLIRHSLLYFNKRHNIYSVSERFSLVLNEYNCFLKDYLGHKGGRILDLDARFSIFDDYSTYDCYWIVEEDKYFRAFFTFRKYLERWDNVVVTDSIDSLPERESSLNYVLLAGAPDQPWYEKYKRVLQRLGETSTCTFICQLSTDIDRTTGLFIRDVLSEVMSIDTGEMNVTEILQLRPSASPDSSVLFIDGTRYAGYIDKSANKIYYSSLLEELNNPESRFVLSVPRRQLHYAHFDPAYYFLRTELKKWGTIPLSNVIKPIKKEYVYTDHLSSCQLIDSVVFDERLNPVEPEKWTPSCTGWYYRASTEVLLIDQFFVGYCRPVQKGTIAVLDSISAFVVDETFDIRYIVKFLQEIKEKLLTYFEFYTELSDNDLVDLVYLPDIKLADQQAEVEGYLRKLRDNYIKSIDVPDYSYQVLVMTPDRVGFENSFDSRLKELDLKVLDYVTEINNLEVVLKQHCGKDVPALQKADALIVDASAYIEHLIRVMFAQVEIGDDFRVYFYADDKQKCIDSFHDMDWLVHRFEGLLVTETDFLNSIKEKLKADSSIIQRQFGEFFAAARRFDEQYPDWKLIEYAESKLSRKPFNLDIREFRAKIDNTLGRYFKDNNVVPGDTIIKDGAIPDLLYKSPYYTDNGWKVSLCEDLDYETREKEKWIRAAYCTIRKVGNVVAHNSSSKVGEALSIAFFTLFTEIFVWLDKEEVRERYQSGRQLYCLTPFKKNQGK